MARLVFRSPLALGLALVCVAACTGTALADGPRVADAYHLPTDGPPTADDGRSAADAAPDIGVRLAALGRLRPLGDDFDLAVGGLFSAEGAEGFRRWRTLADTLAEAAEGLPRHRVIVVARQPDRRRDAADRAAERAQVLVDGLIARGVDAERIRTVVAPPDGDIELEVRFERVWSPERAAR